jgi:hypothetical protein
VFSREPWGRLASWLPFYRDCLFTMPTRSAARLLRTAAAPTARSSIKNASSSQYLLRLPFVLVHTVWHGVGQPPPMYGAYGKLLSPASRRASRDICTVSLHVRTQLIRTMVHLVVLQMRQAVTRWQAGRGSIPSLTLLRCLRRILH